MKLLEIQSKFNLSRQEQSLLVEQFLIAWNQGDLNQLLNLMTEDVGFYADGGGKATAALKPLQGQSKVARFLLAIKRSQLIPNFSSQTIMVNNKIGVLNTIDCQPQSVFSLDFRKYRIGNIFAIVNPDKLKVT